MVAETIGYFEQQQSKNEFATNFNFEAVDFYSSSQDALRYCGRIWSICTKERKHLIRIVPYVFHVQGTLTPSLSRPNAFLPYYSTDVRRALVHP